ncbi:hypothetical protein ACTND8_08465, partial [Atopobiaceae bacterium HCP3S3_F7]
ERGLCYAQPQTAQAPRLEVPAGGLLLTGVALALKIRRTKYPEIVEKKRFEHAKVVPTLRADAAC